MRICRFIVSSSSCEHGSMGSVMRCVGAEGRERGMATRGWLRWCWTFGGCCCCCCPSAAAARSLNGSAEGAEEEEEAVEKAVDEAVEEAATTFVHRRPPEAASV